LSWHKGRLRAAAAYKLGHGGEEAQVLMIDETGKARVAWTHGQDPYRSGAIELFLPDAAAIC
jgi:hypothetical protein